MDLNRLSTGEKILGGSALLLLLTSFISLWAKYESPEVAGVLESQATRENAWSEAFNFLTKLGLILTIVALVLVVAKAAGAFDTVNLPAPLGLIYLGVAGLAALLIVLTAVIGPQETYGGFGAEVDLEDFGVEVSRGPLLYLGALLSLAMAGGAFMHFSGGDVRTRTGTPGTPGTTGTGGTTGPPPTRPPGT